jgi:hypothetical protein
MQCNEMTDTNHKLAELEKLVREFEDCTLKPDDFHHRDHLAVALWYECGNSDSRPSNRFRTGLLKFVQHNQLAHVYHETITLFWVKLVHHFYRDRMNRESIAELVEGIIEEFGDHRVIYDYYSKDLLDSDEAKARWVEPDLKQL